MQLTLKLRPWKGPRPEADLLGFAQEVAKNAREVFTRGMRGSHSGVHYPNLPNRSSAPGEFPATQSGRMLGSQYTEASETEVTHGTTAAHSVYMLGTSRMPRPRKMSREALDEGLMSAEWRRHVFWRF